MQAFGGSHIGKVRSENQDHIYYETYPNGLLAIVCDGMGGMRDGLEASETAITVAFERFRKDYTASMPHAEVHELLRSAVADANHAVYWAAMQKGIPAKMGTTLVGVFARETHISLVNVGDSRCYRIGSEGPAEQLTTDHTVAQALYEQGVITAEMRATHARRNELTRAVGVCERLLVDMVDFDIQPNEQLLLCSDGLYGMVREDVLADVVRRTPPEQVPSRCITLANENGGNDNISVILLTQEKPPR